MAANDNRNNSTSAEKALDNLRKHRDDLIRKLANEYDENDAQKRLEKLPTIVAAIKAVKKAIEEHKDEQSSNKKPETLIYND
jgi:predicted house-cleaning noncanonical NTP pyrophosphatase (MazG superfamily)